MVEGVGYYPSGNSVCINSETQYDAGTVVGRNMGLGTKRCKSDPLIITLSDPLGDFILPIPTILCSIELKALVPKVGTVLSADTQKSH